MFTKKTYPDFWNEYVDSFQNGLPNLVQDNKFVILDTETTGFDVKADRILSIGSLVLQQQKIDPKQAFEIFVEQERYTTETVKIHGILKKGTKDRITELEALKIILETLKNSVLVAHHAGYDIAMINNALKRNSLPKLKNKSVDTSRLYFKTLSKQKKEELESHVTLDDLAKIYSISKKDRHTALGDAYITAIAFLHILEKMKPITLHNLLKRDGFFNFLQL